VRLSFTTDQGNGALAAFGLIVLQADETLENEFRRIFVDPDVACYHARIPSHPQVTPATLSRMAADLPRTAGLLPAGVAFDAIAYACTSGATVIGQEAVAAAIHASHPDVPVTDPITAVMAACRALRASRLGFLTPYRPDVSQVMRRLLVGNGFDIVSFRSFEQEEERVVSHISEGSTLEAIVELGAHPECQAVFASCTNLRTLGILEQAERLLGKPVISSNRALAWHLLTLAGVNSPGPGRLFAAGAAART
jgi:maleate isomerase